MPLTIYVDNIVVNGDDTFTIYTCNTLHARKGMVISGIGTVIDFTINSEITVSALSLDLTIKTFTLPSIGFHSGTLTDVDGERGTAKRVQGQVTPFMWLREPYTEEIIGDKASANLLVARVTLYLMDACNPNEFSDVIKEEVILPMRNLMDAYILQLQKKSMYIAPLFNYTIINRNKAGVEGTNGYERNLFDENLSGAELRIDLTFKKECSSCVIERFSSLYADNGYFSEQYI